MKAITITTPGGPEVLKIEESPLPQPGPDDVLIKVAAAGVNRADIYQRQGNYKAPDGLPQHIPGLEVAGTIEQCGANVTRWKVGDKVCALLGGGGYAEYCVAPAGNCLPLPDGFTFEEGAALPEVYFTIWSNLYDRAKLQPGESLLVHGGSSGIGTAAIQLGAAMGNTVYVTAGSDDKCMFCEQLGATKAINYKKQNFGDEIIEVTKGTGVNVILDMVGGPYLQHNLECLAPEGRLVYINTMLGRTGEVDLGLIMHKRLTVTGSTLRSRETAFKDAIARSLEEKVWPMLNAGKIKPVIHAVYQAEDAPTAHQVMEESSHIGKIIIRF